ncbi:MAG TPA: hypothetical protein VHV49_15310, partial [Pseudonocardiaceae bacterium]|nr:hypothetical protein [Pseudonocardiaceae bacterium]
MVDPDSSEQAVEETATEAAPRKWGMRRLAFVLGVLAFGAVAAVAFRSIEGASPAAAAAGPSVTRHGGDSAEDVAENMVKDGKQTFRFDTFGDEPFWSGTLQLDKAIEGAANGGEGPGVSPATALAVGLKVDVDALPASVQTGIKNGTVDLNDPATTLALLKLNAVVGVKGTFNSAGNLTAVGIECALCHSTVDNSFAPGIGHRLDGWANRDLNV